MLKKKHTFPRKRKKETHCHSHHTYYVFATAKPCPITLTQNPEQDKFSTCHHTIPQKLLKFCIPASIALQISSISNS